MNRLDFLQLYDDGLVLEHVCTVSDGNILQFKAYTIDDDENLKIYDGCYELTRQEARSINKEWYKNYLDIID